MARSASNCEVLDSDVNVFLRLLKGKQIAVGIHSCGLGRLQALQQQYLFDTLYRYSCSEGGKPQVRQNGKIIGTKLKAGGRAKQSHLLWTCHSFGGEMKKEEGLLSVLKTHQKCDWRGECLRKVLVTASSYSEELLAWLKRNLDLQEQQGN